MRTFKFLRRTHKEFGTDGWLWDKAPSTYEPISGMGVAHDILEHFANDHGTVKDELLALGAALFVRGDGGYWANRAFGNRNPGENLAPDIVRLGIDYNGIEEVRYPESFSKTLDDYVEEWIRKGIRSASDEVKSLNPELLNEFRPFFSISEDLIRKGYRKARRRYKGIHPEELSHMFCRIEEDADELLKLSEECDILRVRISLKRKTVNVCLIQGGFDDF